MSYFSNVILRFNMRPRIHKLFTIVSVAFILLMQPKESYTKECRSMDIRNHPNSFRQLENCTVIKGSLIIVLMTDTNLNEDDFLIYSFPELREITEFMIVYQVYQLTTLRNLFPNLVVIRGEKLFLNYALAIDDVPNLNDVGLISLISIQRGHVYINRCPGLCYVNTISWENITESLGTNVIKHSDNNTCPTRKSCRGCRDERCWSSKECQKFKDDNLLNLMSPIKCHPLCLGGCRNSSPAGCNVCQGISDHGVCVEKCPSNKLLIPEYFRCYTHEECLSFRRLIHKGECLKSCPAGYTTTDYETGETSQTTCYPCVDTCPKICEAMSIQHLSDAERLKGCTIINGTLEIRINNRISESDLKQHLSSIEDIHGFLKISGTTSITSLSFLSGLKKIHGYDLDYKKYALVIYHNQNLIDLWPDEEDKSLVLGRGGLFIHSNYKLCFLKIRNFQNRTEHDISFDFTPKSDVEPSCNPVKLETNFTVLGIDSVSIRWREADGEQMNGTEYILFYTDSFTNNKSQGKISEECYQDVWMTQLIMQKDLQRDGEYFVYNLTNLKQYTEYSFYIQSYRTKDKGDNFVGSESRIQNFTTKADLPFQQFVRTFSKTMLNLTLSWSSLVDDQERIDYYIVDLFHQPDKKDVLDGRDYCIYPLSVEMDQIEIQNKLNCCAEHQLFRDDYIFHTKIGEHFECSLDSEDGCRSHRYSSFFPADFYETNRNLEDFKNWPVPNSNAYLRTLTFSADNEKKFIVTGLEPFKLYMFHFYACNNITNCGPYALHSDRTLPDPEADRVFLKSAAANDNYQMELEFDEPKSPNGLTVAFNINYKASSCDSESCEHTVCITRLEHETAEFRYAIDLERGFYKVRIRSISISGPGPYTDWIEVDLSKRTVSWVWYVLTIIAATITMHLFIRWRKKAERVPASSLIRYRYTDRDELLMNY